MTDDPVLSHVKSPQSCVVCAGVPAELGSSPFASLSVLSHIKNGPKKAAPFTSHLNHVFPFAQALLNMWTVVLLLLAALSGEALARLPKPPTTDGEVQPNIRWSYF